MIKSFRLQLINLLPVVFTLSLFAILYSAFYPGAMTVDSITQLAQARLNTYTDWHPPIMAFVWHLLLKISDGPAMMLLFHMTMLWLTSLILYYWGRQNKYRFALLFLLIPFLPWILNFQFVIWKDVGLAYSWALATALAIFFSSKNKFPILGIIMISFLFLYGLLVRPNSITAAIFLFLFLASCIFKKNSIRFFLVCALCCITIFFIIPKVVNIALHAEKTNPQSYVMFDDVVALKMKGVNINTFFLNQEDILKLKSCGLLLKHKVGAKFCINKQIDYAAIKSVWISGVSRNLILYLNYRLDAFIHFINLPMQPLYYTSEFTVIDAPYTFQSPIKPKTIAAKLIIGYVKISEQVIPLFFKPYFWLFLSALLIVFLWKHHNKQNIPMWLLPLSGLSYILGYFPTTTMSDFRYIYWSCMICTITTIIVLSNLNNKIEPIQKK